VFSLGAILCEILTGAPPYRGDDVLIQAAQANLGDAYARLDECDADTELVQLCKQALSPLRVDRPRDASVVAETIGAHLAEVEQRAHRSAVAAAKARAKTQQATAETHQQQKGKRLTVALAASLMLAMGLAGGVWGWIKSEDRNRREELAIAVTRATTEAHEHRGAKRYDEAIRAAERAESLGSENAAALVVRFKSERKQREQAQAEQASIDGLRQRLAKIRDGWGAKYQWDETDDGYAALFAELRVDLADEPAAVAAVSSSPVRADLVSALELWALVRRSHLSKRFGDWEAMLRVADGADDDAWRRRLRAAIRARDRAGLESIAAADDITERSLAELDVLGEALSAERSMGALHALWKQSFERHPDDYRVNLNLARALLAQPIPRRREAVAHLRAATILHPASGIAHWEAAGAYEELGDHEAALESYMHVVDAGLPGGYRALVRTLQRLDRLELSIKGWQEKPDDRKAQTLLWNAAFFLSRRELLLATSKHLLDRWPDEAWHHTVSITRVAETTEDVEAIYRAAVARWPEDAGLQRALVKGAAWSWTFPKCLEFLDSLDPQLSSFAREAFLETLWQKKVNNTTLDELLEIAQAGVDTLPEKYNTWWRLGYTHMLRKEFDLAQARMEKAIDVEHRDDRLHADLAWVLYLKGDHDAALDRIQKVLHSRETSVHRRYLTIVMNMGKTEDGIALYRSRIAAGAPVFERDYLADLLKSAGRLEEAIETMKDGIALDPWSPGLSINLANLLLRSGDVDGAVKYSRMALQMRPGHLWSQQSLSFALLERGDYESAVDVARRMLRLHSGRPGGAYAHFIMGRALGGLHTLPEAIREYERAVNEFSGEGGMSSPDEGNTGYSHCAYGLAMSLHRRGRIAEAVEATHYGESKSRFLGAGSPLVRATIQLAWGRPGEAEETLVELGERARDYGLEDESMAQHLLFARIHFEDGRYGAAAESVRAYSPGSGSRVDSALDGKRRTAEIQRWADDMDALANSEEGETDDWQTALLLWQEGRASDAVALFRRALDARPADKFNVMLGTRFLAARAVASIPAHRDLVREWLTDAVAVWRKHPRLQGIPRGEHTLNDWLVHPDLQPARDDPELADLWDEVRKLVRGG